MEAVLAVAVLAVGVIALFRAFSSGLRAARESRERLQAALLLEGRVREMERAGDAAAPAEDALLGPLSWTREDAPDQDGTRTDVTLAWGPDTRRNDLTLSFHSENR
jgi:Tfp pilus assembly protein PilV